METTQKILAEIYCIQHFINKIDRVNIDYDYLIAIKPETKKILKRSHKNLKEIISKTLKDLHKINGTLANYCNNTDILINDEDYLVQKYFETKNNN